MDDFHKMQQQQYIVKMRTLLDDLPEFVTDFIRGIEHTTSIHTRLAYIYDVRLFLNYLCDSQNLCVNVKYIKQITLKHLEQVTPKIIECYLEYLSYYETKTSTHQNGQTGKARKLATIKTLYHYFYKQGLITTNAPALVTMPKLHQKPITYLEIDEIAKLLDTVESGKQLTEKQQVYHKFTKKRDLALVALLLGTGIRVSECVGINIQDIDFNTNGVKITRKGGDETIVYFNREVENYLKEYLIERQLKNCKDNDEPFFLSLQNKRISVRSVQLLVKKYSAHVTQLKKITPHKLRSTYGTTLYQETGDIYLVADVLGHKDVNTTKKHYAHMDDRRKQYAASIIKLREES